MTRRAKEEKERIELLQGTLDMLILRTLRIGPSHGHAIAKAIAQKTSAEYFYAGNAQDLKKVYESLSSKLTVEKKETEVSALLAMAAAVLTLLSAGLSLLWFNRIL